MTYLIHEFKMVFEKYFNFSNVGFLGHYLIIQYNRFDWNCAVRGYNLLFVRHNSCTLLAIYTIL